MIQSASYPPSIHHLICSKQISLLNFLSNELAMDELIATHLLALGAIYVNKERTFENRVLNDKDYVRVHPYPKRYNTQLIDWQSRRVFENEDFIAINKPACIPMHATLDNAIENVLHQCSLAFNTPLYVTQRLDVPTSGIVILAKTKQFQSRFNRMLLNRKITKTYHAVTKIEPPMGHHIHFMEKSLSAPKIIHPEEAPDRLACELILINSQPISLGFLNEICLITGRTHQIRAQLGFLNCPILGDTPYGGEPHPEEDSSIYLQATSLLFHDFSFRIPVLW